MSRPFVHPTILAAKGVPFPLPGLEERTPTLCYSFAALMRLEEEFGSIGSVLEVMAKGEQGQAFGGIVRILAAGFVHEPNAPDGRELSHAGSLAGYLDPSDLGAYSDLLADAFGRAFPEQAEGSSDPADPTSPAASPGESGTTTPPSATTEPMPSSGE